MHEEHGLLEIGGYMHRELAERLVRDILNYSSKVDQSVAEVALAKDQGFLHQYRRAAGQVMGFLYFEILRDIFLQYPDLKPEGID
jgi:hypothetical protein